LKVFNKFIESVDITLIWRRDGEFPEVGVFINQFVIMTRLADKSIAKFVIKERAGVYFRKFWLFFV
jgi:hypothetical protein